MGTPGSGADASLTVPSQPDESGVPAGVERIPAVGAIDGNSPASDSPMSIGCEHDAGGCLQPPVGDAGAGSACPGCLIGNSCVASNEIDPANPCQRCNPSQNAMNWSSNDGAPCDDGVRCTINDTRNAGVCTGAIRECDDGVACNGISACDELSGECTEGGNQCGANMACDIESGACVNTCNGCLINGTCLAEGAAVGGNPCLVCTLSISSNAPSAAPGKNCGSPPDRVLRTRYLRRTGKLCTERLRSEHPVWQFWVHCV